jgi:hypothetical protein
MFFLFLSSTFGFIFLFKWIDRRTNGGIATSSRRNKSSSAIETNSNYVTDAETVNNMFFAHQVGLKKNE